MPGKRRVNRFHDGGQNGGSDVEHRPREKPLLAPINNLTGITLHRDAHNRRIGNVRIRSYSPQVVRHLHSAQAATLQADRLVKLTAAGEYVAGCQAAVGPPFSAMGPISCWLGKWSSC